MNDNQLPFEPPETEYISANYVLKVPVTDSHLSNSWKLRVHAAALLKSRLGDDVQLTSMRVKTPNLASKSISKVFKRVPNARLYVTTKF